MNPTPTPTPIALMDLLEPRQFFAATPVEFNPTNGDAASGRFVSRNYPSITGGTELSLRFYIANKLAARQTGSVDLSYVLVPKSRGLLPGASKFDPLVSQEKNVAVKLPAKGRQYFSSKLVVPDGFPDDDYVMSVMIDRGGAIDAGTSFNGATVNAFYTIYSANFVAIRTSSFSFSAKKNLVGVSGTIRATLTNTGNATPPGTVLLKVFAATTTSPSNTDVPITQLNLDVSKLKPRSSKTYTILFDTPSNLAPGSYYLRLFIDRTNVGLPSDNSQPVNVFSRKPVKLA